MTLLIAITLSFGVPVYSTDIPAPVVGLAFSYPQKIEVDSKYVTPYVRYGIRGIRARTRPHSLLLD